MANSRRKASRKIPSRPSVFFLVTLSVGLLFLIWLFVQMLRGGDRSSPPAPTTRLQSPAWTGQQHAASGAMASASLSSIEASPETLQRASGAA